MFIKELYESSINKNRNNIVKRTDAEILSRKFLFSLEIFGPITLSTNLKSIFDILVKLLNLYPTFKSFV